MWVLKLKITHDCTIGNRCKQLSCETLSTPLTQWSKGDYEYVLGQHILICNPEKISLFIKSLKKDKRAIKVETSNNIIYLLERHKKVSIPARLYNKKMFFVKPVLIDKNGVETWELCSFEKNVLLKYIQQVKKEKTLTSKIEKLTQETVKDVFYPKVMPNLSEKQKQAFELAIQEGYYKFPRKIDLGGLARIMKSSLPTLQEHLRKAEEKIIPFLK